MFYCDERVSYSCSHLVYRCDVGWDTATACGEDGNDDDDVYICACVFLHRVTYRKRVSESERMIEKRKKERKKWREKEKKY